MKRREKNGIRLTWGFLLGQHVCWVEIFNVDGAGVHQQWLPVDLEDYNVQDYYQEEDEDADEEDDENGDEDDEDDEDGDNDLGESVMEEDANECE